MRIACAVGLLLSAPSETQHQTLNTRMFASSLRLTKKDVWKSKLGYKYLVP